MSGTSLPFRAPSFGHSASIKTFAPQSSSHANAIDIATVVLEPDARIDAPRGVARCAGYVGLAPVGPSDVRPEVGRVVAMTVRHME